MTFSLWNICEGVADLTLVIFWFFFITKIFPFTKANDGLTHERSVLYLHFFFMVAYGIMVNFSTAQHNLYIKAIEKALPIWNKMKGKQVAQYGYFHIKT